MEERYIASIDLGTSKFGLCVARVKGDDVQIVYYKETPSDGIRGSVVANPMKASIPLRKAIEEAQNELMIKILQVVVGMPRNDVLQVTATGGINRSNPDEYISTEEVENLKAMALETYPLEDQNSQIMYGAVAQSFSIDDMTGLVENDVVGTLSNSLEGNFKVFIGSRRATTAIDKIFNSMDIAIAKKYFLPDVVARTVLSNEERQNGVALVDIGAGVTSVAIYHGGIMRYYAAIPFGGKSITGDIRTECGISESLAEKIKLKFGACMPDKLASLSEKVLQIRLTDPYKEVSVKYISEIINARAKEIIDAVLYYIQESGLQNNLRSGIVLTGGCASLVNLCNLFKEVSGYDVRTGYPKHLFSASVGSGIYEPSATSAIGMVLAAKDDRLPDCVTLPAPEPVAEEPAPEEVYVSEDETFENGQQGTLIPDDAFGEEKPAEEKARRRKEPKPRKEPRPKKESIIWKKVTETVKTGLLGFYDEITKGE